MSDAFQVFEHNEFPLGESFLVVSIATSETFGTPRCEAFLLAPQTGAPFRAIRLRLTPAPVSEAVKESIDLVAAALAWANGELATSAGAWVESHPGASWPMTPRLTKSSPNALTHLWVRRWQRDLLQQIRFRTENEILKSALARLEEFPEIQMFPID